MSTSIKTSNNDPIFLDLLNSEDDNCPFIPDSIPEQPDDIISLLEKSDKQLVLTSDNVIGIKLDPLLNEINSRESPVMLHLSDTDVDQMDICNMVVLQNSENSYFGQNMLLQNPQMVSKIDKNMNSLSTDKKSNSEKSKCDILEKTFLTGLTIELTGTTRKFQVILQGILNKPILPKHFLTNLNGYSIQPFSKQPVKMLENVILATNLDMQMPCIHTEVGLRIWLCPVIDCNRAFYKINLARLHALQHLAHKPFKCDYPKCIWAFYTSGKLKRHQETHSKRKDFVCSYTGCERRFTTIYNLKWHRRDWHEKPPAFQCTVKGCNKCFQHMRARELHLKTHGEEEAPYRCHVPECNKPFFLYTALSTHSRVHAQKESDLRCQWPNCGRIFEQPCRLKQHTLQHTGQRPFMCTFEKCKWAFSTASKLKRHLSTHTNERKFHCTMGSCSKSFLRSEHLKDHTLTHIGQRSFHCDGKYFYDIFFVSLYATFLILEY